MLLAAAVALAGCTAAPAGIVSHVHGTVMFRDIPGKVSGFTARPAAIYLPPAARTRAMPVIELLHGTPGGPSDWLHRGDLKTIANIFAAGHGGSAPIIVMPDINGSKRGDSECITHHGQNVEKYLVDDVPNYMRTHFRTSPGLHNWTIGGLSEGGTCSIMLALRYPRVYGNFADLSGLSRPTVGTHDNKKRTIKKLFGGSLTAYQQHDPVWLLRHHQYPTAYGWFETGRHDAETVQAQRQLVPLSRRAGVTANASTVRGGHDWPVWRTSLQQLLPWVWARAMN
jgi:S-formylglutathione hydrolase FrmB